MSVGVEKGKGRRPVEPRAAKRTGSLGAQRATKSLLRRAQGGRGDNPQQPEATWRRGTSDLLSQTSEGFSFPRSAALDADSTFLRLGVPIRQMRRRRSGSKTWTHGWEGSRERQQLFLEMYLVPDIC